MAEEVLIPEVPSNNLDPGSVKFPCPKCGKYEIVRPKKERQIVIKYKCPNCEFEGPN